jgi:Putative ATP-dependant zinc protease
MHVLILERKQARYEVKNDQLEVIFFAKGHPEYTGKAFYFDEFSHGMVASSNGQAEARYKVRTIIRIGGKRIRARLTLADRSTQTYPVLIGRNVLRGKFIVDVKAGEPLIQAEKQRSKSLQSTLKKGRA